MAKAPPGASGITKKEVIKPPAQASAPKKAAPTVPAPETTRLHARPPGTPDQGPALKPQPIAGRPAPRQAPARPAPAAGGGAPPSGTPGTGTTPDETGADTAQQIINGYLQAWGLSGLDQFAWNQIVSLGLQGVTDFTAIGTELHLNLMSTPEWQQRFKGLVERQQKGLPAISEQDYITLEDSMYASLQNAGVPVTMLGNDTIANAIGNDVSAQEFSDRLTKGLVAIQSAPPEVAQQFAQIFGPASQGAMVNYFLDPANAEKTLEGQVATATASGIAAMHNIKISTDTASKIGQMQESMDTMASHMANLDKLQGLFQTTVGEEGQAGAHVQVHQPGTTLTQEQGVQAEFGLDATAQTAMTQRVEERQNEFHGGGGASATQTEGYAGIGSAKSF